MDDGRMAGIGRGLVIEFTAEVDDFHGDLRCAVLIFSLAPLAGRGLG
jgi:hypothetical protein